MSHRVCRPALLSLLFLWGIVHAQDVVYHHDRATKKEVSVKGTIESESPSGIKIKLKDGKDTLQTIPAASILRVDYQDKDIVAVEYRRPFGKEDAARRETRVKDREQRLNEALDGYAKLERGLQRPEAKRFMQFKIAEVTALLAQDDANKIDNAIKLLTDFKGNHPTGWEIMSALKLLARLLEESGKMDEARKAYEELADLPDAPLPVKHESMLLVGRLLLRGGKYADAEKRLAKLASTISRDDSQAQLVKAYLVESQIGQDQLTNVVKDLNEVIRGTSDVRVRGVAYNLLGDFYRKKGQLDEALWQYLRVDAQYNEDAEEQAKALYHLATLFDKVKKDPLRGKECATRLMEKRYTGTVYQRLLMQETKK